MPNETRRPHKKSRAGCTNCKRRKVKCDESKPSCSSCSNFGIACVWPPTLKQASQAPSIKSVSHSSPRTLIHVESCRRGRGRPRKDWSIPSPETGNDSSTLSSLSAAENETEANDINLNDTELLLHFIQSTAQSIAGDTSPENRLTQFWSRNVPRIGLSYPFVLHLMYAVAAYHSVLSSSDEERKQHFKGLASHHLARGTAGLASTTTTLKDDNCGAAYLGATLVCYCTFAAGPVSSKDLMVCHMSDEQSDRWVNLVSGLRLIRQAFAPDVLFAGLMSPLGSSPDVPAKPTPREPLCKQLGKAPVQWEAALKDLRRFVALQDGEHTQACLYSVDELVKVFEGVYGDSHGNCTVTEDYQFVLGWIYRMKTDFICAIQSGVTAALAILAHFAVLLKSMDGEWWLKGWAEHLCIVIRDAADSSVGPLLDWPADQIFSRQQ